LFTDHDAD
jgi:hypothetical protein